MDFCPKVRHWLATYEFRVDSSFSRHQPITRVFFLLLAIAALVYGTYLRTGDQHTKDFWVDEVWRAGTIVQANSFFDQEMPVQLSEYILGKLGVSIFGQTEIAFRIWPLACALASLALFSLILFKLFHPSLALLGTFLFSVSYGFVEHAHEFKPYTMELFFALSTLFIAITFGSKKPGTIFFILSLVSLLASNIFPFFAPLLVIYFLKSEINWTRSLGYLSIPFVIFLSIYLGYTQQLNSHNLFTFWQEYYLNSLPKIRVMFTSEIPKLLSWYALSPLELHKTLPLFFTLILISSVISPLLMLCKRDFLVFFVALPLVLQIGLSTLGLYPAFTRVGSFYYPFLLISLLYLPEHLIRLLPKNFLKPLDIFTAALIGVLAFNFCKDLKRENHPGYIKHQEESKILIAEINNKAQAGDVLAVSYHAHLMLNFYEIENRNELLYHRVPMARKTKPEEIKLLLQDIFEKFPDRQIWFLMVRRVQAYEIVKNELESKIVEIKANVKTKGAYLFRFQS